MQKIKSKTPQFLKNWFHLFQAMLANLVWGFPSRKIKVVGITGTNGKTTTVQMLAKIFEEAEKKVALASTINFQVGEKKWVNKTKFTTLSAWSVQKFIHQAVRENCEYLFLETSSHALDQFRVWGVKYKTALITNATREHLDYHKDMERYRKAKKRLFKMTAKNRGCLIVNLDMENPIEFLDFQKATRIGYTANEEKLKLLMQDDKLQVLKAQEIDFGKMETRFQINGINFLIHFPGRYNVENALAAISVAASEGIELEIISKALDKIKGVTGRMERISAAGGVEIVIDYAVTPDSLEKLYEIIFNMKKKVDSKIIAVFGSCGDRDRGKRPIMGKIVAKTADYIILTNEDPYFEDPQRILDEIERGVLEVGGKFQKDQNFWQIMDRREAIQRALKLAKSGDIVVLTGKGAEEMMAIGSKRIPWNDRKVVLEELEKTKA